MAAINAISLTGNLTRDPEMGYSQGGVAFTKFSLAVNSEKDKAIFINCVVFGKQAEFVAERIKKGDSVGVSGKLGIDSWEKDGIKRTTPKVVVNNFVSLSSMRSKDSQASEVSDINEDEIPF